MPDSLSNIIPTIYAAIEEVTRGIVGFAGAAQVDRDLSERVALGQSVVWAEPNVGSPRVATPGCTGPCGDPLTANPKMVTIERQVSIPIAITGDQYKGLQGNIFPLLKSAFVKGIRALVNDYDLYLATKAIQSASRAVGTPGTTPFGVKDDMTDFAALKRLFRDNGYSPENLDLRLVLNNSAMENLEGKMTNLFHANEFGSDELSRFGYITQVQGFKLGSMPGMPYHTKGTGAGYVTSGETAIDVEEIALVTGAGTVLAGDVVKFTADADNMYVVNKGITAPGAISIGEPGARMVIPTGNAMTIQNSYEPNVAFDAGAFLALFRPIAIPPQGDSATDRVKILDPISGLGFEVAYYPQYLQGTYDIQVAYGATITDSSLVNLLLG